MRGVFGLGASALAGLAGVMASLDGDQDIVPFFVGLTFIGAVEAWAVRPPFEGPRRWLAQAFALLWLFAAIWIAVLLLWYQANVRAGAPPGIERAYLGLPATVYHLVGLYGGLLLVLVAAFGPVGWLEIRRSRAGEQIE